MKCKVCGQQEDFIYWALRNRMCVHCHLTIDSKLNPIIVTDEWKRHSEISEKAVEKYLKVKVTK